MKKYFCNYNQSLALKELGFEEPCFAGYRDSEWIGTDGPNSRYFHAQLFSNHQFDDDQKKYCSAPLKSQVFDWFRNEHGLNHMIDINFRTNNYITQLWRNRECLFNEHSIKTYEEAESACIDKLIEIVKNNLDK